MSGSPRARTRARPASHPGWMLAVLGASLLLAEKSLAQETARRDGELSRIQALADSGRASEARQSLSDWYAAGGAASGAQASRARLLRARLATDPDSAEVDYVWVAIEGDAAQAPEAWLRLAQLRLMRGDPERALADLERLRASFPVDPWVAQSWLWTGHAHEALGDLDAACEAWERTNPSESSVWASAEDVRKACEDRSGLFAVQVGAFGAASGAETMRRRVEEAGFAVYVVTGEGDGLHRVRSGRFVHLGSAALLADRLRQRGFEAVVVLQSGTSG